MIHKHNKKKQKETRISVCNLFFVLTHLLKVGKGQRCRTTLAFAFKSLFLSLIATESPPTHPQTHASLLDFLYLREFLDINIFLF